MNKQQKRLFLDILFIVVSICLAVYITQSGIAEQFVRSFSVLPWLGVLFAGMLFTSVFTTPVSIALLGEFSHAVPLPVLAIVGGVGAVLGDSIIFYFVKDRISEDFKYILTISKRKRLPHVFKNRLFRFFVPFVGALIIASPLPDEIGIAMLGAAKVRGRVFVLVSLIMNALGICIIGLLASNL